MISIVTISTVSTVAAWGTVAGLAEALALIVVLTFLVLLIQKEMVSAGSTESARVFSRGLNIGIAPLAIAFAIIAGARVLQVVP
ncbi:MAG: hypothetical protein ACRDI2_24900 [Chloroflexota bacterium]